MTKTGNQNRSPKKQTNKKNSSHRTAAGRYRGLGPTAGPAGRSELPAALRVWALR